MFSSVVFWSLFLNVLNLWKPIIITWCGRQSFNRNRPFSVMIYHRKWTEYGSVLWSIFNDHWGHVELFRWFYQPHSQQCHQFQYGGCGGNSNSFTTAMECEQACRSEFALTLSRRQLWWQQQLQFHHCNVVAKLFTASLGKFFVCILELERIWLGTFRKDYQVCRIRIRRECSVSDRSRYITLLVSLCTVLLSLLYEAFCHWRP